MGKAISPMSFGLGLIIGASAAAIYGSDSGKSALNKYKNKYLNKYDERINELNEKLTNAQELADDLKKKIS